MFGVDGLGGSREQIEYWSNLVGGGAIFRDPDIYRNGGGLSWNSHHRGTIIIDRRKNTVVVDLKMIVSNLGEPERLVPSEANGTYQIKRWVR